MKFHSLVVAWCFVFIYVMLFVKAEYEITTIAGGGVKVEIDGEKPDCACLNSPTSAFAMPNGDVYVADTDNNRIRKVSNSTVNTIAGTGVAGYKDNILATLSNLKQPTNVAVNSNGEMYIADKQNHRIRKISTNGIITTIAGTGTGNYNGDNRLATNAQLNSPSSVAIHSNGEIYIADTSNHRIRKLSTNGTITTIAGTGTNGYNGDNQLATNAQLNSPSSVAIHSNGEIYIADKQNHRIRKISTNGIITTIAGTGTGDYNGDNQLATNAQLKEPDSVAIHSNGEIYIADTLNHRIRKISTNGIITTIGGTGQGKDTLFNNVSATSVDISYPKGVYVSINNEVYFASAQRIFKISNSLLINVVGNGFVQEFCGEGLKATKASLYTPQAKLGLNGEIYIADKIVNRVFKMLSNGLLFTIAGTGFIGFNDDDKPALQTNLANPYFAFDDPNNSEVYICDSTHHRIRKILTNGKIKTIAGNGVGTFGGDNQLATSASIYSPIMAMRTPNGEIYIADTMNHRIRKISTNGIITTIAGTGTGSYNGDNQLATNAQLNRPASVAVDTNGEIYIADTFNHRIRKISTNGRIQTIAGNGNGGYTTDNVSAITTDLNKPYSVAIHSNGEIFISDTTNNRIRKISTNGIITTIAGTGTGNYNGDNQLSTNAQLRSPYHIELYPNGDVLISDMNNGRVRKLSKVEVCNGIMSSNANVCNGVGKCIAPDICNCSMGYTGQFCQYPICNEIPSNYTKIVCSGNGNCISPNNCSCIKGYFGDVCQNRTLNTTGLSNNTLISNNTIMNDTLISNNTIMNNTIQNNTIFSNNNTIMNNTGQNNSTLNETIISNNTIIQNNTIQNNTIMNNTIQNNTIISNNNTIMNDTRQNNSTLNETIISNNTIIQNNTIQNNTGQSNNITNNSTISNNTSNEIINTYNNTISNNTNSNSSIPILNIGIYYSKYIYVNIHQVPLLVMIYITNDGGEYNSSLLSIEWKQIVGQQTNFTQLTDNNLEIYEFYNKNYVGEYIFQVTLTYLNMKSSTNVSIHIIEEEFSISLYETSSTNKSNVIINVETNPLEKLYLLDSSSWIWTCVNSIDKFPCDGLTIQSLNNYGNLKTKSFELVKKSMTLTLTIGSRIGSIQLSIDETVPVISILSVSPPRKFLTEIEVLELNLMISLNDQVDGINSEIDRVWTLNNESIPSSMLLIGSDIVKSNRVLLDISKLTQGTSYTLSLKVTTNRSLKSSVLNYEFTVAVNPTPCQCSISPKSGYFLDTEFTIDCPNCVQSDNVLKLSFLDFKTGLKVALFEGRSSSFKIPLPYTGSEEIKLFISNKNTNTNAQVETPLSTTLTIPSSTSMVTVKKKKAAWESYYKTLSSGDPRKIVFSYISTIIEVMFIPVRSLKVDSFCENGVYNSIINICICDEGYKTRDCTVSVLEWIEISNTKFESYKLILQEMKSRNEIEPQNEMKLSSQISALFHSLVTFDQVNEQMFSISLSIFKKQIENVLKLADLKLSSTLLDAMSSTFKLLVKARLSNNSTMTSEFLNDMQLIGNNLSMIRLRNHYSSSIQTNLFTIVTLKLYPYELSTLSTSFDNNNNIVSYPTMMTKYINNVNMRKLIYIRNVKSLVQQQLKITNNYEIKDGVEVFTSFKSLEYELSSQLLNQNLVIPQNDKVISYSFEYTKDTTNSISITNIGNTIRNETLFSQIICESDGNCNEIAFEEFGKYVCKCSQVTRVSLIEKSTRLIETQTITPPPTPQTENNLAYFAFFSFLGVAVLSVIGIVVSIGIVCYCVRKNKKKNKKPSNNTELQTV